MTVEQYMTPNPFVVTESEPIEQIAELIHRHRIHQVPVVDDANRLVGIVTDRDLRSAMGYDGRRSRVLGLLAEDIMSANVVTVTPGQDLREAVAILSENHYGALPVVVGEHVVGILTARDLMRRLLELLDAAEAKQSDSFFTIAGVF